MPSSRCRSGRHPTRYVGGSSPPSAGRAASTATGSMPWASKSPPADVLGPDPQHDHARRACPVRAGRRSTPARRSRPAGRTPGACRGCRSRPPGRRSGSGVGSAARCRTTSGPNPSSPKKMLPIPATRTSVAHRLSLRSSPRGVPGTWAGPTPGSLPSVSVISPAGCSSAGLAVRPPLGVGRIRGLHLRILDRSGCPADLGAVLGALVLRRRSALSRRSSYGGSVRVRGVRVVAAPKADPTRILLLIRCSFLSRRRRSADRARRCSDVWESIALSASGSCSSALPSGRSTGPPEAHRSRCRASPSARVRSAVPRTAALLVCRSSSRSLAGRALTSSGS